jgi:CRISPR-associated exonuclease Cas4
MEQNSDRVLEGKLLHESAYPKVKNRNIQIDDFLNVDIMENGTIREIKISSKMEKASKMQLLYYLYCFKKSGVEKKGIINYVLEKKKELVELTKEYEQELCDTLDEIQKITESSKPPELEKLKYCVKCAYYEFCFVKDE